MAQLHATPAQQHPPSATSSVGSQDNHDHELDSRLTRVSGLSNEARLPPVGAQRWNNRQESLAHPDAHTHAYTARRPLPKFQVHRIQQNALLCSQLGCAEPGLSPKACSLVIYKHAKAEPRTAQMTQHNICFSNGFTARQRLWQFVISRKMRQVERAHQSSSAASCERRSQDCHFGGIQLEKPLLVDMLLSEATSTMQCRD